MGPIGIQEMLVIFLVALVLFGPKKLPELGKTIGKAITEFRRAQSDLKATFEREMQNLERETESLKEVAHQTAVDISGFSPFDQPSTDSTFTAEPVHDSTAIQPSTVSASEVPGAESHGTTPAEHHEASSPVHTAETTPGVEGTVPRSSAPQTSAVVESAEKTEPHAAANQAPEPVQHS